MNEQQIENCPVLWKETVEKFLKGEGELPPALLGWLERHPFKEKKMKFTDQMGSRGIQHQNILVVGDDLLVKFTGETLPGICRVESLDYKKNGKWSHHIWDVTLEEGVSAFVWYQDFNTGLYLNAKTWKAAIAEVRKKAIDIKITDEAIVRYVRSTLPSSSAGFDQAEKQRTNAAPSLLAAQQAMAAAQEVKSLALQELAHANEALKEEVRCREAAVDLLREAQEIKEKARKARELLVKSKGIDLAELKRLIG